MYLREIMVNLDLDEKYVDFIKNVIESVLDDADIYIFGSRTQGTAQKYSDVDIAVDNKSCINIEDILKLKAIFRNSTFPYKVDIIDLNSADNDFLKIIEPDLYKI